MQAQIGCFFHDYVIFVFDGVMLPCCWLGFMTFSKTVRLKNQTVFEKWLSMYDFDGAKLPPRFAPASEFWVVGRKSCVFDEKRRVC